MNLPDQRQLTDAEWQLQHATGKLAPFLAELTAATATDPTDPAAQARVDKTRAMLRALESYVERNQQLLALLTERENAMHEEMAAAEFRYRQMRLDCDFYKRELEHCTTRYYQENAIYTSLLQRFPVCE